jgi:predicted P-loop ATPase
MTHDEHLDAAAASLGAVVIDAASMFGNWRLKLILNDGKKPRPLVANVITAFREAPEWKDVMRFCLFTRAAYLFLPPPWVRDRPERANWKPRLWTDMDDIRATEWMQRQGIHCKDTEVGKAAQMVASDNAFHPVRQYLDRVATTWDGESRIETLMAKVFGTEPTEYVRAVFRCFMIGSVARAYEPGCKMDTMLVLHGPQGARKSTAVRELYGSAFFTDDMPPIGGKDAQITVGSAWCIELAELAALTGKGKQLEQIKAFITRREDDFRPPYGRRNIKIPRQAVLVGTTNADTWMKDETGARRFWPIRCGANIDVETLIKYRNELWAEAVALYRLPSNDGGAWWFTDQAIIEAAQAQQEDFYVADPWEGLVHEFIALKHTVTTEEILISALHIPKCDLNTAYQMRVAAILKRAGWVRKRARGGGQRGYSYHAPQGIAGSFLGSGPISF